MAGRPKQEFEIPFSGPFYDLRAFGSLMRRKKPPARLETWHITRLAIDLTPLIEPSIRAELSENNVLPRISDLPRALLSRQIKEVSWREWFTPKSLWNAAPEVVDLLSYSLLATCVVHLLNRVDPDLWATGMVNHGLRWACVFVERSGHFQNPPFEELAFHPGRDDRSYLIR